MAVTLDEIAVELGRTTPEPGSIEAQQWQRFIDQALMLIKARLGDPALLPDQDMVDYVVTMAVVAHLRNPDNSTSVEVAVDDARSVRRYSTSQGRVVILDDWWALLKPARRARGAMSVPLAFQSGYAP